MWPFSYTQYRNNIRNMGAPDQDASGTYILHSKTNKTLYTRTPTIIRLCQNIGARLTHPCHSLQNKSSHVSDIGFTHNKRHVETEPSGNGIRCVCGARFCSAITNYQVELLPTNKSLSQYALLDVRNSDHPSLKISSLCDALPPPTRSTGGCCFKPFSGWL